MSPQDTSPQSGSTRNASLPAASPPVASPRAAWSGAPRHGPRRSGRRASLPIDPWPRASLGERMSVGFVLVILLVGPFCAAGAALAALAALVVHACRSYDLGAALRGLIERNVRGPAGSREHGREPLRTP